MSDNAIGYKRMVDVSEAVSYLEALAQSIRDGRIVVAHGEKTIDLEPPSAVVLEIEAKQKKDKTKFAFEIAWKHEAEKDAGEPFKISSGAESDAAESLPEE